MPKSINHRHRKSPEPITLKISRGISKQQKQDHGVHWDIRSWNLAEKRFGTDLSAPKFGKSMLFGDGIEKRSSSAELMNVQNVLYNAPVVLGNGQVLQLDVDTGSADVWARGQVQYGSGSVSGAIYQTTVSLGESTTTSPLAIGVATVESGFGSASDGILGLGFPAISSISTSLRNNKVNGVSGTLIDAMNLPSGYNRFGIYLSDDQTDRDNGEITIGGDDSTKYVANTFVWFPLSKPSGFWMIDLGTARFSIGGVSGDFTGGRGVKNAILDTGTTLIVLDDPVANAINAALGNTDGRDPNLGVYKVPCQNFEAGPNLSVSISSNGVDAVFNIPARSLIHVDRAGGFCYSGIVGGVCDSEGKSCSEVILGDMFLRRYYSIYDWEGERVGFAQALHPSSLDPGAVPVILHQQAGGSSAGAVGLKNLAVAGDGGRQDAGADGGAGGQSQLDRDGAIGILAVVCGVGLVALLMGVVYLVGVVRRMRRRSDGKVSHDQQMHSIKVDDERDSLGSASPFLAVKSSEKKSYAGLSGDFKTFVQGRVPDSY
ncbi:hypothetical protein HDU76_004177 [Blyttiomyces sp. JEL0837]|nr:hypothetical protein HDU76_004177 [Blyttiomyces sp. JEL0837]